jgi:hypothetical protein
VLHYSASSGVSVVKNSALENRFSTPPIQITDTS